MYCPFMQRIVSPPVNGIAWPGITRPLPWAWGTLTVPWLLDRSALEIVLKWFDEDAHVLLFQVFLRWEKIADKQVASKLFCEENLFRDFLGLQHWNRGGRFRTVTQSEIVQNGFKVKYRCYWPSCGENARWSCQEAMAFSSEEPRVWDVRYPFKPMFNVLYAPWYCKARTVGNLEFTKMPP